MTKHLSEVHLPELLHQELRFQHQHLGAGHIQAIADRKVPEPHSTALLSLILLFSRPEAPHCTVGLSTPQWLFSVYGGVPCFSPQPVFSVCFNLVAKHMSGAFVFEKPKAGLL